MKEILERLDGCPGVHTALVMTPDGILIASLDDAQRAEKISAYVSAALLSMERDAEELELQPFRRLTLWAAKGRIIVLPLEQFAMVVVADRETDLGFTLMELTGLARSLIRRSRFNVDV